MGKKKPERGMFRQMSNGKLNNKQNGRGLFRQGSDLNLSLFKKKEGRSLFARDGKISDFEPIVEVSKIKKSKKRLSKSKKKEDRGLRRSQSLKF